MYVAVTRARSKLYLSYALSRMLHGQTRYGLPSRFLEEIPDNLIKNINTINFKNNVDQIEDHYSQPSQQKHTWRIGESVMHEKFGQGTVLSNQTKANNGFIALAELDSNLDGLIDKNDQAFSELGIWQDIDSNGVTDAGELHTLSELGVKSLSLQHAETTIINQGNLIGLMGSFQTEDGKIHELADIWFKTEALKNAYLASEVNPSELIDIISASNLVFEELVVECNPELLSDITNESNVSQNSSLNSVDDVLGQETTEVKDTVHLTFFFCPPIQVLHL
jgi:hypothetical protein